MSAEPNKVHKEKRGFLEFLAVKAELPSDVLGSDFRIELRGRNTLFMQGCRRILKYSPDEMIMSARGFAVDTREFRPHITLAREVSLQDDFDLPGFSARQPRAGMTVSRLSLMRSDRIGGKLTYAEVGGKDLR